jgi:hypothetical protein
MAKLIITDIEARKKLIIDNLPDSVNEWLGAALVSCEPYNFAFFNDNSLDDDNLDITLEHIRFEIVD